MINLIKADLYQLRRTLSVKIYILIAWISAISIAVVLRLIQLGKVN